MFSGLGNFPDLNSTFAQLSNFSLDALQGESEDGNKATEKGVAEQVKEVETSQNTHPEYQVSSPTRKDFSEADAYAINSRLEKLQQENILLADRARAFEEHVQNQEKELRRMRESAAQTESTHAIGLRQVQEEKNRLQSLCEELQHQIKSQETEISILTREKKCEGDPEVDNSVNAIDEIVAALKDENSRLSEKARMFEDKYSSVDFQLKDLQAQLHDTERAHEKNLLNLREDFAHKQKHMEENHSNQVTSLQQELAILSEKLEKTKKQVENDASSFQSTLEEAESRFERQNKEWRSDFETKEKEHQIAVELLQKQKDELQQTIESNEKEYIEKFQTLVTSHQNEITQLRNVSHSAFEQSEKHDQENNELVTSLQSKVSILQHQLEQKEKSLQDLSSELKLAKETHQSVLKQLAHSQEDNTQKSISIEELTGKVQTLTEKMRELVQRHSELKSKASSMQQDKDSEVIKLQLKLESQREQFEEQRFKWQEINERYSALQKLWSEAQRDQQNWEDEKRHLEARMQEIQSHLDEKESALSSLEIAKKRAEEELSMLLRESEKKYSILSEEFRKFQEQSGNNAEHAQALENYKRRSQLALKKANASAATLQEENVQLQQQLLSAQKDTESMREAEENARKIIQALEQEKALFISQSSLWEAEKLSLVQKVAEINSEMDQLHSKCEHLQEQLHQQQQNEHAHATIGMDATLSLEKAMLSENSTAVSTSHTKLELFSEEQAVAISSQSHQQIQSIPPSLSSPRSLISPTDANPSSSAAAMEDDEIVRVMSSNANDDYFTAGVISSPASSSQQSAHYHQHPPSSHNTNNNNVVLSTSSSTASGFILVDELQQQVHSLQRQIAQRSLECDETVHMLQKEKEEKEKLAQRCEELAAFLSRARKVTSSSSNDNNTGNTASVTNAASAPGVNLDYLKQVVFKFVTASEHSERSRLLPVLCALLSFTPKEKQQATAALEQWQSPVDSVLGITATNVEAISSAFSWLGGLTSSTETISSSNVKK